MVGLVAAAAVTAAFYSSFGENPRGPLDSILAFDTYLKRGTGPSDHNHPWHFYLERLVWFHPARGFLWTEALLVALALAGLVAALVAKGETPSPDPRGAGSANLRRFLGLHAFALAAIYSAVPYKTPWCMASFVQAMAAAAGFGAATLLRRMPGWPLKALAAVGLVAGLGHLGWQAHRLSYVFSSDPRNPHVYAHTSRNALDLARFVEVLGEVGPEGRELAIHVVTPENYWPLPWSFRRFERAGYWSDAAEWARDAAAMPPPGVVVLTDDVQETVDAALRGEYHKGSTYNLRPASVRGGGGGDDRARGQLILSVYVRDDVWQAFASSPQAAPR